MDNCKFHLDDTKLPPIGHESALAIGLIVLLLRFAAYKWIVVKKLGRIREEIAIKLAAVQKS